MIVGTPLLWAAYNGNVNIAKLLVAKKAAINQKNKPYGNATLHLAALQGHVVLAKMLIDNGADINQKNFAGLTPLYLAKECNQLAMVDLLATYQDELDGVANQNSSSPNEQ